MNSSDGNGVVSPTWSFTSSITNIAPVAGNYNFTLSGDMPTNFNATALDPNSGDTLVYAANSLPGHGLLQSFDTNMGAFSYLPAHGFTGTDSFTYSATDGQYTSSTATVQLTVQAPVDADGDGLPDYWQARYGVTNAVSDPDSDGQNNWQEYLANTNPTNAASVFHILSASVNTNNQAVVTWTSEGGTRYRVQYCDGSPDGSFADIVRAAAVEIDPASPGTDSTQTFTDTTTPTNGARYYRIAVVQ